MNPLFAAALEVQEFLEARQWRYCFIGGLAVLRWGEMRATGDIDLLVLTGFGNEKHFIDELIDRFRSRVADPVEFALSNRVILLTTASGVPVDLVAAVLQGVEVRAREIVEGPAEARSEGCVL